MQLVVRDPKIAAFLPSFPWPVSQQKTALSAEFGFQTCSFAHTAAICCMWRMVEQECSSFVGRVLISNVSLLRCVTMLFYLVP